MLFIPLFILGIVLYIIGHRVSSVLIFFFFCMEGYQIAPEFLFETHAGISKGIDFAVIYIIVLFLYGITRYNDYIPINPLSKLIFGYLILLFIAIGVSIFHYGIPALEVIRVSRSFFLVLSYFVIRRLDSDQFQKVMYALFYITAFQCILFFIQSLLQTPVLNGASSGGRYGIFYRFYNYPRFLYAFCFLAIFTPLLTIKQKSWMIPFFLLTIVLSFSRSAILVIILLLFIGYLLRMQKAKRLFKLIPVFLVATPLTGAVILKQIQGDTLRDIQSVLAGDFVEVVDSDDSPDASIEDGATMIFRMALFFERFVDVIDSQVSFLIGKGLSVDGSPYTNANFRYSIGLEIGKEEKSYDGYIAQLYSPDISWSNLILRYGILGTIIYTIGFFYLTILMFRNQTMYSIPFFLYSCFLLMNSLSSDVLFSIVSFVPFFLFFDRMYYQSLPDKAIYSKSPALNY